MAYSGSKERCVTLTSSDDEEKQDCMPKIIDSVSLQGCSTSFAFTSYNEREEDNESIFYPQCEIREENSGDEQNRKGITSKEKNSHSNEEKNVHKAKKRLKPIHLTSNLQHFEPKATHSRHIEEDIVDANKLALQENVFKTKEIFDTFLRVCQDLDNSPEMQKVVDKLGRAYGQARQEYLGSPKFQSILEEETEKVNTSNTKPWLNLKLVLDELKYNKKSSPSKLKLGESEDSQDGKSDEEPIIECAKKRRHLKKLEKTLRALNLKIKKLEEKEVDLDDEDSAYVKLDRYRAQFTKIYNKVCEIKGKLPDADRPYLRKVSFAGTTYPHINRCIERYYNKHRAFPDFQDIKKLVVLANKQENIEMTPGKIHEMAMEAFKEFGEMLKRLRQYDDYDIIVSYLEHQVDPARDNQELQEKLNMNAQLFKKKEQEVIDKFAAQDAGIHTGSGEGSEIRPKKKRKLSIKIQKLSSTPKKHMSSSESTDNSSDKEEDIRGSLKTNNPGPLLDSSSESSEEESKKVKDKGKRLVGKTRFVKKGFRQKLNYNPKPAEPKTAVSSDDESNPKDFFTNYLGLHMTPKKDENKVLKSEKESDDEIILVQNMKNKSPGKNMMTSEKSSDSSTDVEVKPVKKITESDSKTTNSTKNVNGTKKQQDTDSDSDLEPPTVVKSTSPKLTKDNINKIMKKERLTVNNSENRKKTNSTNGFDSHSKSKKITNNGSDRISLSSDSENESAERTSADESEFSAKRSVSDASKALSLDLSDHSSDNSEHSNKDDKKESYIDDSIVVLSEDVVEVPKSPEKDTDPKNNIKDSDSDNDVCVLTQSSSETRTVAPRRTKQGTDSNKQVLPVNTNVRNNSSKRLLFTSSTPIQKPNCTMLKRRGSNLLVNGVTKKPRRLESSNRQLSLPHVINGASRKTLNHCKPASSPNTTIPLIELD